MKVTTAKEAVTIEFTKEDAATLRHTLQKVAKSELYDTLQLEEKITLLSLGFSLC